MLVRFLFILFLSMMLSGCYSSNGQIMLFNKYSLYGDTPSSVVVQKGDTLYSIARRYDVSVQDLASANNLRAPFALKVGRRLSIPSAKYHVVQKGDTLYSIARQYNTNVAVLSQNNHLEPPYALNIGQKIALNGATVQKKASSKVSKSSVKQTQVKSAPKKTAAKSTYTPPKKRTAKFSWPVQGKVISNFGVIGKGRKNDGINISAPKGTAVKAADKGTVAYAGNGLKGFGNLILIKHPDGWITAYAHNEKLLVRKGQAVQKGEKIATVGSSGGVNSPQLHFEVRAGKKAVNPKAYLP